MEFISETVAEGRVTTDPQVVVRLLDWVAGTAWHTTAERDALEARFLALLHHLDYKQDSLPAEGQLVSPLPTRLNGFTSFQVVKGH